MIKIEVKNAGVTPRDIIVKNGPKAGTQMRFYEQEAWAHTCDDSGNPHPYPQRIVLNIDVDKGQQPYASGMYQPAPESLYVDRFNALSLGRLKLRPLVASAGKAAA